MADQRIHPRRRVLLPVAISANGRRLNAVATDLSAGGLYLLDDARLAGLERIDLTIGLPDGTSVDAAGLVARQQVVAPRGLDVPGYGVRFEQLNPAAATAIVAFVGSGSPTRASRAA